MKIVYLIRHGEVENPEGVVYGRLPGFHLSKRGKKQAKSLSSWFSKKDVDFCVSSPMERCIETAEMVFPEKKIIKDDNFIEIDLKHWEGIKFTERDKKELNAWIDHPERKNFWEPLDEVRSRSLKSFNQYLRENGNFAIITHAIIIDVLRATFARKGLDEVSRIKTSPGSVTVITFEKNIIKSVDYKEMFPNQDLII